MVKGVDLSKWNKHISFDALVKAGVKYAILRLGYTASDGRHIIDPYFHYFYETARRYKLDIGAYWYGLPEDIGKEQDLADFIAGTLAGYRLDYPLYYDVEGRMLTSNKANLTDHIVKVGDALEKYGYWFGVYMSASAFMHNVESSRLKRFTHWVAAWRKSKPKNDNLNVDMWQYGGEKNLLADRCIGGCIVDQDYCYRDFPALIKSAHKNGY